MPGLTRSDAANLLTVAEVAARMRVSKMTVYRLIHSGDLPALRVGRSFRVPAKAASDYLASRLRGDRLISSPHRDFRAVPSGRTLLRTFRKGH